MKAYLKMLAVRGIVLPLVFLNLASLLLMSKLLSVSLNTQEPLVTFYELIDIVKELWIASGL